MKMKYYIFGAHSRARTLAHYLRKINSQIEIKAFLYNDNEKKPDDVLGIPVFFVGDGIDNIILDTSLPVYIATRSISWDMIIKSLEGKGFYDIRPVDVQLDNDLRNKYLKIHFKELGQEFIKIDDLKSCGKISLLESCQIYSIRSVADKKLTDVDFENNEYVAELQVGRNLTEKQICNIVDNEGDNISDRNKQFCELTGLYWIWKNSKKDVLGLEHYRRHFILPKHWLEIFIQNEIDVILPTPLYVDPSLAENYRSRHVPYVLDYLFEYFGVNFSEELNSICYYFEETSLYSPCNMFIMKKEVLDDLCSWLFPILFALADRIGTIDDVYQNRYPGFLSERLISYFFESNRDKYKVVYADKDFRQ